MDESNSADFSRRDEGEPGDWMLPSAALDRFEPPENMVLAKVVEKEVVRYGFNIGSLGLLIQPGVGSEVMQMPTIWTLPGAQPWLLGLINLRGSLVPVYDLKLVLGLEARSSNAKSLVLVFDQGDKAVGMLIDDFPKPLAGLNLLPNLPHLPTALVGHVHTGYVKSEMIWLEFDHGTFLNGLLNIAE